MIIRCPHCAFSRTVDEDKIPAAAQTATCPKCHHKFRFRGGDQAGSAQDNATAQASGAVSDPNAAAFDKHAGASGNMDHTGLASEGGEDIWDRVASLGESWADYGDSDPADQETAPGEAAPGGGTHGPANGAPWEHIREFGLLKAFVQTVLQSILHPRRFFSGLGAPRLLGLALVFYIVVTALQTYLFQAWMQLFPASALGLDIPPDYALYDSTQPLHIILAAPVVWAIFLFLVSTVSAMAMRLLGGRRVSPAAVMRVMAYSASPMLLGVLPFIGTILGQVWAMALFLLGCKHAFRLNLFAAIAVILPVYLCLTVLKIILSGSF